MVYIFIKKTSFYIVKLLRIIYNHCYLLLKKLCAQYDGNHLSLHQGREQTWRRPGTPSQRRMKRRKSCFDKTIRIYIHVLGFHICFSLKKDSLAGKSDKIWGEKPKTIWILSPFIERGLSCHSGMFYSNLMRNRKLINADIAFLCLCACIYLKYEPQCQ